MNKFEELAIRKQEEAYKITYAQKQFAYSCQMCCERNLRRGLCRDCPVALAHQEAVQAIASGERKKPDMGYRKYVDKKGHVTLVVVASKEVDTDIKVIIK